MPPNHGGISENRRKNLYFQHIADIKQPVPLTGPETMLWRRKDPKTAFRAQRRTDVPFSPPEKLFVNPLGNP